MVTLTSPDPAVVERQMYLTMLGIPDDPNLSLADLRGRTAGGANVHSAATVMGWDLPKFQDWIKGLILPSAILDAVKDKADKKYLPTVNVLEYGAVGDGVTDDFAKCQVAADALRSAGGGTLLFPAGRTYALSAGVDIPSNVTVEFSGATILKPAGSPEYYVFRAGSKGLYDGARNITFRGGTISGSFAGVRGASITLNKARKVVFENITFTQCVISGHAIDLGGCNNVKIRNCVFEGFLAQTGRYYVEAIQIDYAYRVGNAVDDGYSGSYDGEPTRNVKITGCRFIPLTLNGTTYPAPNPLGSHARIQNTYLENILFKDNYVEGCRQTSDAAAGFETYARGWIHFFFTKNVRIIDNTFINLNSAPSVVINSTAVSTGTLLSDTSNAAAVDQNITPLVAQNWQIRGNTFKGFNAPNTTEPLIFIGGHGTQSIYAWSIRIKDNFVEDSCPNVTDASNTGGVFARLTYIDNAKVKDNDIREIRTHVDADHINSLDISSNTIARTSWTAWELNVCTDVTINKNKIAAHCGALHTVGCFEVLVAENRLKYAAPATAPAFPTHMSISSTETVLAHHNSMSGLIPKGIFIYTNSKRARFDTNVILGATLAVDLSSATITDCTQTGNVTA
jgi:hypothetical protein